MAQITVTYKDFEEMKTVARELLKDELESGKVSYLPPTVPAASASGTAAPVPSKTPVAPIATQQPASAQEQPKTLQTAIPTTEPTYTREDLSRAAITLMDKGPQAQQQLQQLVQSFGVMSLMELPADQYGAFATALRGLGAQI